MTKVQRLLRTSDVKPSIVQYVAVVLYSVASLEPCTPVYLVMMSDSTMKINIAATSMISTNFHLHFDTNKCCSCNWCVCLSTSLLCDSLECLIVMLF